MDYLAYVGTFTRKESKGIYAFRYNSGTQQLTPLGLAAEIANPSFVAISPNGRFLYAVSAVPDGKVGAFRIDFQSGHLMPINSASSHGGGPCHLICDRSGKTLFVANYTTGGIAALKIRADGGLEEPASFYQPEGSSKDRTRQLGPHGHSVNIPQSNQFLLTTDLGLDKIFSFRIDAAKATFTANDPPFTSVQPGSGPRHLAFTPDERYLYLLNEIGSSINAFRYDATHGSLTNIQTISTLPSDFHGESAGAEIAVDHAGRFVYASNRGHDSIAQFAIDQASGKLSIAGWTPSGGKTPRHFELDPAGAMLFAENQDSDNIVAFTVDAKTGRLTATGKTYAAPTPVCLKFVPVQ